MAASGSDTVSVVERTRPIAIDGGIVGAHFLGHDGQELINIFGLAIKFGITARKLKDHVYAYPTFSADIRLTFAHA